MGKKKNKSNASGAPPETINGFAVTHVKSKRKGGKQQETGQSRKNNAGLSEKPLHAEKSLNMQEEETVIPEAIDNQKSVTPEAIDNQKQDEESVLSNKEEIVIPEATTNQESVTLEEIDNQKRDDESPYNEDWENTDDSMIQNQLSMNAKKEIKNRVSEPENCDVGQITSVVEDCHLYQSTPDNSQGDWFTNRNNKSSTSPKKKAFTPNNSSSYWDNETGIKKYKGAGPTEKKSFTTPNNWRSETTTSKQDYYQRNNNVDDGYNQFETEYSKTKKPQFIKVKEIQGDLFGMGKEYSLAHCVAEDMNMGSGIAVQFRQDFKQVGELLAQGARQGDVAFLEIDGRFIYYLVTKRESSKKPTYEKFYLSIKKWSQLVREHNAKKLAIPRLGCGLDRLEWDKVKFMIEYLFKDVDTEITVCNFQQGSESEGPAKVKNSKVVNVDYPVSKIENGTIIVYMATADGQVTEEMEDLDKRFNFLLEFRKARKTLGSHILTSVNRENHILFGCVVRQTVKDNINFIDLQKCIRELQKWNRTQKYEYLGFQAIEDRDDLINNKIINLLRNGLRDLDVYVCWTGKLANQMPMKNYAY